MNKLTTEQLLFAHRIGANRTPANNYYSTLHKHNGDGWFYYDEGWLPSLITEKVLSETTEPIDFDPLYNQWIDHDGGECPVDPEDKVNAVYKDGSNLAITDSAGVFIWKEVDKFKLHRSEEQGWPEQRADAIGQNYETTQESSDGSTASYYELPPEATELQHLISYRNMNAQDGEIFRAIYRKGRASHYDALRDAKKVLFYAQAEVERLEKYGA